MQTEHNTVSYPLSSSQTNIWRLEQSFPGTPINNICETIRIQGRFDADLLQRTLNRIVSLDGTLRTRLSLSGGTPVQYEAAYAPEQFPVFDFSLSGPDGFAHWETSVTREAMPLVNAPLYYFAIIRLGEHEGGVFLKTHHLISDGWSQVLLTNRIAQTYLALTEGREPELAPAPDYRLHVEAEREYQSSRAFSRDRDFWREMVEPEFAPAVAREFGGAAVSPVGCRRTFTLSEVLNHAVYSFCTKNRVAPFSVFYMAVAIYLHRTGQNRRFCLGVPIYNRSSVLDRESGGMFVSTLPLVGSLDEDWTFEQFNEHFTEQWYDLLRHQRFPFTEISELARRAHPQLGPLFNIVLSFQNSRIYTGRETSVHFSGQWNYSGYQAEHLCLHLNNIESEKRCSISYDYLTQLFSEAEIERLHSYLINILTYALEHPDHPIRRIPMLDLQEREKVIYTFNRTDRSFAVEGNLYDRCRAQALEHPTRVAVIAGGRKQTYQGLMEEANRVAHALSRIAPGERGVVAIALEKGLGLPAALVGTAQAGHAWVLLSPDLPPRRAQDIVSDCGARALISTPETAARLTLGELPLVDPAALPQDALPPLPCPASGDDLAYIVYTSGSSGKPKGVEIEQRSLLNFALSMQKVFGHGAVLSLCNVGFDAFMLESVTALLCGRTLLFPVGAEGEDPRRLARLTDGYAAGFLACTPSTLRTLLRDPEFARSMRRIEAVVCGGEPFPSDLLHQLRRCTDARIYNQYGPSETTVGVSLSLLNDARAITAGRPMPGCRLYVLDEHLNPLPIGACGELFIGGLCVGRGYHNLPELTAASFLESPFEPDERLYRTGDLACWTHTGEIVLRGRRDGQVKLRGLRIELSEIAACMASHPEIGAAAARLSLAGAAGGQGILLYYTAERELPPGELIPFAATYLPAYMIPARFIRVSDIPLTQNGKTDFSRLPLPDAPAPRPDEAFGCAAEVLSLLRAATGRADMGAQDDYFACGGDSLGALELLNTLERRFGVRLRISDLYAVRTAEGMAALLDAPAAAADAPRALIPKAPEQDSYPLTPTQQSLYLQTLLDPRGIAYNMPGAFAVRGALDADRLAGAYRRLIALEPLLRTAFVQEEGEVVQKILPEVPFSLETISAPTQQAAFDAFVRPFDLARPPLVRAALWTDPKGGQVLFADMHHIIGDGFSSALFLRRLTALYAGQEPSVPALSFADYACWLKNGGGRPSDAARQYWAEALRGVPDLLDLPCDRPRPQQFDYRGGSALFSLDARQSALCRDFCGAHGLTAFAFFAGAFGLLLRGLSGQSDFAVGTPVSGRTAAGLDAVLGPFIRTLPLRFTPAAGQTGQSYLKEVAERVAGLLDHQDMPLEEILALTGARRSAERSPLYSTLISQRPVQRAAATLDGASLEVLPLASHTAKMDLNLEIYEENGCYCFALEYASALFGAESAAVMGRSLIALCQELAEHSDRPIDALSAWHPVDRFRLIDEVNLRCAPFADLPLDRQFDMRALVTPDAPAVLWHDQCLSYAELRRLSDSAAAQLCALGLPRNAPVGVACRRTPRLFAALLGILKAGHAYVPLSASLPEQRIAEMAETAGLCAVLGDAETLAQLSLPAGCTALPLTGAAADFVPPDGRTSADLFHILFTSGSTGKPKGVMLQHRALSNLFASLSPLLGQTSGPILCSTNLLFDTFITESLVPLALGRTVVLADEEEMLLPHRLAAVMERHSPAVMQLTPSRLQMYLGHAPLSAAIGRLQTMILAGEALAPELVRQLRQTGCARVYNLYGPTEAAVYATGDEVEGDDVTIGTPLFNCKAYILDENLQIVPPLARGELFLAGECLALGYAGDDALTGRCFVPDPFCPGRRMYRTGDLVRRRADGKLDFIGRRDRQIKLNGQRVELTEVIGALLRQEGVGEAEAVPVTGSDGSMALRAFVVPAPNARCDGGALQEGLRRTLPSYMVPQRITVLDAMPRTPSGKADLIALAAMEEPSDSLPAQAGDDGIEGLWRQVLHCDTVSRTRSFFEQGGTSLAALSLLSLYYDKGFSLTLSQFYEHPTIEGQLPLLTRGAQPCPPPKAAEPSPGHAANPALGRVLLTGSTGFLGAHLLRALLSAGAARVLCLVRGGQQRLFDTLTQYFGPDWLQSQRDRLEVLPGDLTRPQLGLSDETLAALTGSLSHIVHAAADVRHYAADPMPEEINVRGTGRVIALARATGAALAYVSTISISGDYLERSPDEPAGFDENDFDIGQNWRDNIYVRTKYLAEQQVRAALHNGLSGQIFRVGRLVGRASDGVFQQKPATNSFYQLLRGAACLDCIPRDIAELRLEMTPVDCCADALVRLIGADGPVWHLFHPEAPELGTLFSLVRGAFGEVSPAAFDEHLARKIHDGHGDELAPLISFYQRLRQHPPRITPVCDRTVRRLCELGFVWPKPEPATLLAAFIRP